MRKNSVIRIRGARTNNLKNINVDIKKNSLVVITGVSGSGKSSLAFDTIFAEGQRRYMESLTATARQFISLPTRPEVDFIDGLTPAIALEQKIQINNPRSIVGTVTDIYDFFRILYCRAGISHCPNHPKEVLNDKSISQIFNIIKKNYIGKIITVYSPAYWNESKRIENLVNNLRARGFLKIRISLDNRKTFHINLDEEIPSEITKISSVDILIDRLRIKTTNFDRLLDSLILAMKMSDGEIFVSISESKSMETFDTTEKKFSLGYTCSICGYNAEKLEPNNFSFNRPQGACESCKGTGIIEKNSDNTVMIDQKIGNLDASSVCFACKGSRLKKFSLSVTLKFGSQEFSLGQLLNRSVDTLQELFSKLQLPVEKEELLKPLLNEIKSRLSFLEKIGLGYLTLGRRSSTLSGGELQRIRLATQIGATLSGVTYILDEPSTGLHAKDNNRLIKSLTELRDLGNTVIVVEHDLDTIMTADQIIDIGPGAGSLGGKLIVSGNLKQVLNCDTSETGKYLRGELLVDPPEVTTNFKPTEFIRLSGVNSNNLKNLDINIPLGGLICVTGVSGSGKSTLINEVLVKSFRFKVDDVLHSDKRKFCKKVEGIEKIQEIIQINQKPIGRTPRSTPATYTGIFTSVRELFASSVLAREKGFEAHHFSYNCKGGRCESCRGEGYKKMDMHFLPDAYVVCELCKGLRFNDEILAVRWKGKNIADVLSMSISEAYTFFKSSKIIERRLKSLIDVGLGYIKLGQSSLTFSGGESQRIKLATQLSKAKQGKTLYTLDEPTNGLHFSDIKMLIKILIELTKSGNTVIVIEHNLALIKTANWVIDLGPGGGDAGGKLITEGSVEEIIKSKRSYTGAALKKFLGFNVSKNKISIINRK